MAVPKPSDDTPPDQRLIEAARLYARLVTGQGVQRVTLTLSDGTKRKIDVPAVPVLATDWPLPEGWGLRGDRAARNGEVFRLVGKSLALFAALLAAGDEGLTLAELKAKVWDRFTDDRTVQNGVSKLRGAVRAALGLEEEYEPVEVDGDRYRLGPA